MGSVHLGFMQSFVSFPCLPQALGFLLNAKFTLRGKEENKIDRKGELTIRSWELKGQELYIKQ